MPIGKWYTVQEAAERWTVTPNTVRRWVQVGKATAGRTAGGHIRIHEDEVERLEPKPKLPASERTPIITDEIRANLRRYMREGARKDSREFLEGARKR